MIIVACEPLGSQTRHKPVIILISEFKFLTNLFDKKNLKESTIYSHGTWQEFGICIDKTSAVHELAYNDIDEYDK